MRERRSEDRGGAREMKVKMKGRRGGEGGADKLDAKSMFRPDTQTPAVNGDGRGEKKERSEEKQSMNKPKQIVHAFSVRCLLGRLFLDTRCLYPVAPTWLRMCVHVGAALISQGCVDVVKTLIANSLWDLKQ